MKLRPNFLIVGMERSGSLWTSATLNEHPDIASFPSLPFKVLSNPEDQRIGEMHFFNMIASLEPNMEGKFTRDLSGYTVKYGKVFADLISYAKKVPKEKFYKMMLKRYSELCDKQRGNKKIVGESTPAYVFHLDFIDSLYPGRNMKKICSIREPKDKITSRHFSLLGRGIKKKNKITEEFAMEYVHTRIVKEYEALLAYNGSIHCVTYEKRHRKPNEVVRSILDYLKIEATDETIDKMILNASFEEMTKRDLKETVGRVSGDGDMKESMRKGVVGDWENNMDKRLAGAIDAVVLPIREEVFKKYDLEV